MQRPNSEAGAPPAGQARDQERSDQNEEFAVIERLRGRFETAAASILGPQTGVPPPGEVWIGDDAAVITTGDEDRLLVSTDLVVQGVHFDLRLGDLSDAGWKALNVAASDIAAMGASPAFALLSVAAPAGTDLDRLATGVAEASAVLGCPIVGGDLSGGPAVTVSVTVGALLPEDGRQPLLRSGARPGDVLFVTGPLGASAAGLRVLRETNGRPPKDGAVVPTGVDVTRLIAAYLRPRARVAEGISARLGAASAAIDLSDGLASDVRHLAAASEVGVVIDRLPAVPGATEEEALGGGEDYELLLAAPDSERLHAAFSAAALDEPVAIGRCTDEPDRVLFRGHPLGTGGWSHHF